MKSFEVACPHCKKKFLYHSSEWRPFCSERCRMIDLGQWLNESYTVPAHKLSPEEAETLEQIHEKSQNQKDKSEDEEEDPDEGDSAF